MVDKKVLVILLLLAFHVFYLQDLGERNELLVLQARLLERKIQHEQQLADRTSMGEADLSRLEASVAFNRSLVFPAEENISTAMVRLQQQVKEAGEKSRIRLTGLRAGEPQQADGHPYARLPLSFTVIGSPDQAGRFLVELFRMDSFLRIFTADFRSKRDNRLHLVMSVAAYRLLPLPHPEQEAP
jgi:Tfp pilus assembly protein PilO